MSGFKNNPELAREAARKAHEARIKNGTPPGGGFRDPEVARRAGTISARKARENQARNSKSKD